MTAFLFYYCNNSSLLYSVQIRFRQCFSYNLPCHQFSEPASEIDILPSHRGGRACFPLQRLTALEPASHSCPTPPWFTEISSSHQGILAKRPPSSTPSHPAPAWHSTEKWLTVPESILQKTLNLGVRDSNSDCCSQVYPETGRKAIYLLDLKLATRSHQWDPVRLLYSDSAFKNSRSHWANSSSSWGCQLVEAG